jgi:hypothetical protein
MFWKKGRKMATLLEMSKGNCPVGENYSTFGAKWRGISDLSVFCLDFLESL